MPPSSDRGSIIIGWFAKLVLGLAIVGLVLFDGASMAVTRVKAAETAEEAARAAAVAYRSSRDVQQAYGAALAVTDATDRIDPKAFVINRDGSVTLQLTSEATTLLAHRIPKVREYVTATEPGSAPPAT